MKTDPLKGVRGVDLDFDAVVAEDGKLMKGAEDWPQWVQTGLSFVTKALAKIGVTVNFDDIDEPGVYLDKLISIVEKSPSMSYGKFLALAALRYLHSHVHPDHVMRALKGEA
jgi:hypothetical protein